MTNTEPALHKLGESILQCFTTHSHDTRAQSNGVPRAVLSYCNDLALVTSVRHTTSQLNTCKLCLSTFDEAEAPGKFAPTQGKYQT